jgi:hypothetical protein
LVFVSTKIWQTWIGNGTSANAQEEKISIEPLIWNFFSFFVSLFLPCSEYLIIILAQKLKYLNNNNGRDLGDFGGTGSGLKTLGSGQAWSLYFGFGLFGARELI